MVLENVRCWCSDSSVRFPILGIFNHLPKFWREKSEIRTKFLRQILRQIGKRKRCLQGGPTNVLLAPLHPPFIFFNNIYKCLHCIWNSSCEVREWLVTWSNRSAMAPCTPLGPFGLDRLMSYRQGRARNGTRAHARPVRMDDERFQQQNLTLYTGTGPITRNFENKKL